MTTAPTNRSDVVLQYVRPWMAQYQIDAIFCPERYALVEATTKSGKTHGCIIWLFEQAAAGHDGQNFWWVAPVYTQARIAYRRLRRALNTSIPGYFRANGTELTISLANGATIAFKTGENPDNLYGEDVYAAVVDEASRVRGEAWHALRSTLTHTRGPVRIIGNVKGRKNWAYMMARRAESGDGNMHYAKITAYDAVMAGILDQEEVADAKAQLPDAVFRELYLAEPSDDEGNPFGISAIRECIVPALSKKEPSAWGWDLAKSVDWTVGIALDENQAVCRFERWQAPWNDTERRIIGATGYVGALVDSTGVGDPVLEELQRQHANFEGFKFNQSSKQQLMEGLAVAIQQRRITFPDGPIVAELEAFEYVYSRTGVHYSAPDGMHDDCVCALALVVMKARAGMGGSTAGAQEEFERLEWQVARDKLMGRDAVADEGTEETIYERQF